MKLSAVFIVLFILSPQVDWYAGARYSDLFVIPAFAYVVLSKKVIDEIVLIMLAAAVFASISSIFYASLNGKTTSFSDYIFPIFWVRYLMVYVLFNNFTFNIQDFIKPFIFAQFLLVIIGIMQWNNIFSVASLIQGISPIYDSSIYGFEVAGSWRRAFVFSTNSNYYGFLLVIGVLPLLFYDKNRVVNFMVFLTFIGLLISGSRSALFSFSLIILSRYRKQFYLLGVALLVMLVYIITNSSILELRLFSGASLITSWNARVRDLLLPLGELFADPISIPFGFGPLKDYMRTDSHNGWTWMLIRTGILGLTLYITVLRKLVNKAFNKTLQISTSLRRWYIFVPIVIGEFAQNIFKDPYSFEVYIAILVLMSKSQNSQANVPMDKNEYKFIEHNLS